MKWDTSDVGVHRSTCGRFAVVRATSEHWIAYEFPPGAKVAGERGTWPDSDRARAACEQLEALRLAERRRA